MTTIKPILRYPGAKWSIAPWVVSYLPPHKHYIEPYFGSGAVFFNKPPSKHEVINDLSGDVVNLFRVIRDDGERLAALIELTPWAREEYEGSTEPSGSATEDARRFVVRVWQGHGQDPKGANGWKNCGPVDAGSNPVPQWRKLPAAYRAILDRLLNAEIEHRPAVDVIRRMAGPDVLIYADPPYVSHTRKARLYQHEMTDADHSALLDALEAHPGPVVLSGYHCALYDDRLARWHTVERRTPTEQGQAGTEVLWLNDAARPQQMRLL